jgi:hypothetical protein
VGAKPTRLLARTFFARFFESDLMPPGLPQVQLVIWSLALLATPGLLMPVRFAGAYEMMRGHPELLAQTFLLHRLFFITLSMTALGLVALAVWDGVFPDRRDARILTGLPVPGWGLVLARLLALSALAAIFLAGVNIVPTLVYSPVMYFAGGASSLPLAFAGHLVATTLAGLFVFSTLIVLQGLALNLGGQRAADRIAVALQIVFVVALLQLIFFLPRVGSMLRVDAGSVWSDPWLKAMPSVWFLALYDLMDGLPSPGAGPLAAMALIATAAVTIGGAGLIAATHGRLTRMALEVRTPTRASGLIARLGRRVTATVCPQPIARAVFELMLRTLTRSRSHRLLLAMYVGVALALVCSALVPLAIRSGFAGFAQPGVEILSAPLVLSFLTLVGMRVAIAIPVEPKASWAVRLVEPEQRGTAINGARAAMLLTVVAPTTIIGATSAGALWGVWPALVHGCACALLGWLLVEVLLVRLDKIPFTCTYMPGRSRIGTIWPLYLTSFITYCYTTAAWERDALGRSIALLVAGGIVATAIVALTIHRHRRLASLTGFKFAEEDPDTLFSGFQLSEGFAATTESARRLR